MKSQEENKSLEPKAQGSLSLQTQFITGLTQNVRDAIFFRDDTHIVYPVGHNVCIYNMEEKTQRLIPGLDGTSKITALAVSHSKRYVAIAESSEKTPILSVYDLQTLKRRKLIASAEIQNKSYISLGFSLSSNNEKLLVAMTDNEPVQTVYVWQWEKAKCYCPQTMQHPTEEQVGTQVSFSHLDHNVVLVTGFNVFWYFRIQDNSVLRAVHTQLKKEAHVSSNYTAHLWLPDNGRLLVATDQGEIMLCEQGGEYKMLLPESPGEGFHVMCMHPFSKGFICGGDQGQIIVFEKYNEPKILYTGTKLPLTSAQGANTTDEQKKNQQFLMKMMLSSRITSLALSSNEDTILLTTDNNQIIRVNANLERLSEPDFLSYDFLIFAFHSQQVTGLDVCIKKNLVATCSLDKTIKVWSYNSSGGFNLDINHEEEHQGYSLALHPSGLHLVVGFNTHISLMNIFQNTLHKYKQIDVKQCKEIQFSHGGHLIACQNQNMVQVYNFYTWTRPKEWEFSRHGACVRSISWLEDDSGFVSCGYDENVCLWKLNPTEEDKESIVLKEGEPYYHGLVNNQPFVIKGANFSHVAVSKHDNDKHPLIYVCGSEKDRAIREVTQEGEGQAVELRSTVQYQDQVQLSKIAFTADRKFFFAGRIEGGMPGSVQVLAYPFQKVHEVQAHAQAIERLRLSYDNQNLFTCGLDGSLACFSVLDQNGKRYESGQPIIPASQENLLLQTDLLKKKAHIERLKANINQEHKNKIFELEQQKRKKQQQIDEQREAMRLKKDENQKRLHDLEEAQKETHTNYDRSLQEMAAKHVLEMEKLQTDQHAKIDADQARRVELQEEMKDQASKFEQCSAQLYLTQDQQMKTMDKEQKLEHNSLEEDKNRLSRQLEQMVQQFKETRERVENETWDRIDKQKEDDKQEMATEIDRSMKQKGELTLIMNTYKDLRQQRDFQLSTIAEMNNNLNDEINKIQTLNQQIASQAKEITERDTTLSEKGNRISDLRTKTQELEKFKFVLDYKIKEMKQDIMPRETDAQKLHEQNTKMHQEVKHFDRVSANLKLIKKDLRMALDGLQREAKGVRETLGEQDKYIKAFKDEIFDCLQKITDYKKLKKSVIQLHTTHVQKETTNDKAESNQLAAFAPVREYLEQNLEHLRTNLSKDKKTQKADNARIMKQNVKLLEEINDLSRHLHRLDLETRTELKKKRELKRMKDTGKISYECSESAQSPLATAQQMMNLQNDLGVMEHEIARMQEEEKKWLVHYSKLQGEVEKRRQVEQPTDKENVAPNGQPEVQSSQKSVEADKESDKKEDSDK